MKFVYHQTTTWPCIKKMKESSPRDLSEFIKNLFLFGILKEIERVMSNPHNGKTKCGGVGHIVLISICSAIDTISAYFDPEKSQRDRYIKFIHTFFKEKYKSQTTAELIYKCFRNDSVHGWNLHRSMITAKIGDKNHLEVIEEDKKGIITCWEEGHCFKKFFEVDYCEKKWFIFSHEKNDTQNNDTQNYDEIILKNKKNNKEKITIFLHIERDKVTKVTIEEATVKDPNDSIIFNNPILRLSLYDLFFDFKEAINEYCIEILNDEALAKNIKKRYAYVR